MTRRADPRTHLYTPDLTIAADHRGHRPCTCGMPRTWQGHTVPDTAEANAEHRRRAGDTE